MYPFETGLLHPLWCTGVGAGHIVEATAAGDKPGGVQPVAVPYTEGLLERLAETDPDDVGAGRVDLVTDLCLLIPREITIPPADDLEGGMTL